ncbi:hypothetical protein LPB72_02375 [Hydrogenophaga crassostreae]|uniref:DUF1840 domain-containing protein n=1 Tax=Hydrogenophaga crassostreae TaxID=1763535 RepID=A0A162T6L5_9BURK|nr:DUF1840 domain-containing protein [Hydrogenophaga crassostreae]AOW11926.1 hypothetical protein LPB072_02675 [Hydrogenophaga crassostreae]OAD43873.1 hypothetical protein LPB72_02375 [Hydrogenophaga crassostreae]
MSLYRFKSRETGDLVMLQPHGRRILEILDKDLSSGIIQPEEMPAAVAKLRDAADQEAADQQRQKEEALAKGDVAPEFDSVTLKLRIVPFVEMLQRCEQARVDVVWGV